MNAIERKRQEHAARIRALGSRIRALALDEDIDSADPDCEASAAELLKAHNEDDIKEGLGFAAYLAAMADRQCTVCRGRGAHQITVGSPIGIDYEPCDCARENEKRAKAAAPFVQAKGDRRSDLGLRIAKVKDQLAAAIKRRDEAVAPVDEEIHAHDLDAMMPFLTKQNSLMNCIANDDRSVSQAQIDLEALRQRVAEADRCLARTIALREQHHTALVMLNKDHDSIVQQAAALAAKRTRIAGHHQPKIDRAERTLRRLTYLRGDTESQPVAAEDITIKAPSP
jgi:hypothetical protein